MDAQLLQAVEGLEQSIERAKQNRLYSQQARFTDPHSFFTSTMSWLRRADLEEPPYHSDSRKRDKWLRDFWKKEPHLAGVVNSAVAIDKNRSWVMTGGRNQVMRFTRILRDAEDGAGWRSFMALQAQSFYANDMGAVTELGRDGRQGPLRALYYVDSARCRLTGDRRYPLEYDGSESPWSSEDFFRTVSMQNTDEHMNGLGYSAVSRCIDMAKLMCLHPYATVKMADGSSRYIIDLVRTRSTDYVLSVDDKGQVVPKRITGWYENDRDGRKMIMLRGKNTQYGNGSLPRKSWMTEDHKVLTPDGWRMAGELKTGDKVVTNTPEFNEAQMCVFVGTMLGDASLQQGSGKNAFLSFVQKHHSWTELKVSALRGFQWNSRIIEWNNCLFANTGREPCLTEWRKVFYPSGKKIVPIEIVEKYLSPLLLATWYMDDGNINRMKGRRETANIATCGFTIDDQEKLVDVLNRYGYECTLHRGKSDKRARIHFSADGSQKLFYEIAKFVPPELRYKLPKYANFPDLPELPDFDESAWNLGDAVRFSDEVIVEHDETSFFHGKYGRHTDVRKVYCIDVEDTHNFISSGLVVHNCAIYQHQLEQIGVRAPQGLLLLQNISQDQWEEAMKARDADLDARMRDWFGGVAVLAQMGVDQVDAKLVALSQLPQHFDLKVFTDLLMYAYALCFGYDPMEFWPVQGSTIGHGAESQVQHKKATGKGAADFVLSLQDQLQLQLPETLKFEFEQRDAEGELAEADIAYKWAQTVNALYNNGTGVLTREQAASLLVDKSIIPSSWTAEIEEMAQSTSQHFVEDETMMADTEIVDGNPQMIEGEFVPTPGLRTKRVSRQLQEQIAEDDAVQRAIDRFPDEPIVRYSWPQNQMQVIWRQGKLARGSTRFW